MAFSLLPTRFTGGRTRSRQAPSAPAQQSVVHGRRMKLELLEDRTHPSSLLDVASLGALSVPELSLGSILGLNNTGLYDSSESTAKSGKGGKRPTSPPSNTVSGEAFGAFVDVTTVLGVGVSVPKTPHVLLPSQGGFESAQLLNVSVPGVLASETLTVMTSGAIGASSASSQSTSTVESVDLLNGLVTADLIVAFASCTSDGSTATCNSAGSTIIDLSVNGVFLGDVTPPPNTSINVPGVGTVILNEQISSGDGVHSAALTVNMIHVVLDGALGSGDIIIASAHSDVNFTAPEQRDGPLFITGGGRIGEGRDISTFGLNAGARQDGQLRGNLQYNDHGEGLKLHSTSIDSFTVLDENCVTFSGTARVNGASGYTFTVTEACDNGEPGVGVDTFAIQISGPGVSYANSGTLTGGNLQLHPTK